MHGTRYCRLALCRVVEQLEKLGAQFNGQPVPANTIGVNPVVGLLITERSVEFDQINTGLGSPIARPAFPVFDETRVELARPGIARPWQPSRGQSRGS